MTETLEEQLNRIEEEKKILNEKIEKETEHILGIFNTYNPLLEIIFNELKEYGSEFSFNGNTAIALVNDGNEYILIRNLDNTILINLENYEVSYNRKVIVSNDKVAFDGSIVNLIKVMDELLLVDITR